MISRCCIVFFNDTATTEIYTYCHTPSLRDALPITSERSVYSCIRAAEAKLIQNFAAEFGQENIRANIISPGLIDSSGAQALFQDPAVTRAFTEIGRAHV